MTQIWRMRHLKRYRTIISVFAHHGFGTFIEQLRINRYLPLPVNVFRPPSRAPRLTPAQHFCAALEELGATFIKLGQIVSTRPDLLPAEFMVELRGLQDNVKPDPWESIHNILVEEYGEDYQSIFTQIDQQPLGAASLSQVHAACLNDGQMVVLKVQRPNIAKTISEDLDILMELAAIAQRTEWGKLYNPVEIVNDFAYILRNELDFRMEGVNADRFRSNFADLDYLYIPLIHWEHCTRRVLVEERLTGIKINDVDALEAAGFDRKQVAARAADIVIREVIEDGFFHADPHPGNFFVMNAAQLATARGETKTNDDRIAEPVEAIIAAMDFGMVGYVSQTDRTNLLVAFLLASRNDSPGLAEHLVRIGAVSPTVDMERLEYEIDRLLIRYRGVALKHIQSSQVTEELMQLAFQHRIRLPTDFWLMFKTLIMLDGVARQVDPDIDVFTVLSIPVKKLVREMHMPWVIGPQFVEEMQGLAFALKDLPATGERLVRSLQRGELPFSFQMGIKKETMDQLDRVSTRISLSVLIAAFIVGQALIFDIASENRTALALLISGFMFALLLGIWYVINMLRSGRS